MNSKCLGIVEKGKKYLESYINKFLFLAFCSIILEKIIILQIQNTGCIFVLELFQKTIEKKFMKKIMKIEVV